MPKRWKPSQKQRRRLEQLPHERDLVLEGGIEPLPFDLSAGAAVVQPGVVLWVDAATELVRASQPVSAVNHYSALDVALRQLVEAIVSPGTLMHAALVDTLRNELGVELSPAMVRDALPSPALPGRVRVMDPDLADAVQEMLGSYGVSVEEADSLPAFASAFEAISTAMSETLGAEGMEPFRWDLPNELVAPLFKAANAFGRLAPWEYMPDHPPVEVSLGSAGPEDGVTTLYASILGRLGEVLGVAFYYSAEAMERTVAQGESLLVDEEQIDQAIDTLQELGLPVDDMDPEALGMAAASLLANTSLSEEDVNEMMEDALSAIFEAADVYDESYHAWLDAHSAKGISAQMIPTFTRMHAGGAVHPPGEREARSLTVALEALTQFFRAHRDELQRPEQLPQPIEFVARVRDAGDHIDVPVRYHPHA